MPRHVFSVRGDRTYLDSVDFLVRGIRCSNALISDATTEQLTTNLEDFASYGVNSVAVFFMGSRFGDVQGYNQDATLSPSHSARMARIIEAADSRRMVVLVGCLYWGNTRAKWDSWTQREANAAIAHTVSWLATNDFRNVFVDVDNEGMALRAKGFDNRSMVLAGKEVDSDIVIGTNYRGVPPPEADIALHHSDQVPGKPYVESEGSPPRGMPEEGGYWGSYSKVQGEYAYRNVGVYTEEMKRSQELATRDHLRERKGYMLASTWLQAPMPQGPNHCAGGIGSPEDPGIRWWLEFLRRECGEYN